MHKKGTWENMTTFVGKRQFIQNFLKSQLKESNTKNVGLSRGTYPLAGTAPMPSAEEKESIEGCALGETFDLKKSSSAAYFRRCPWGVREILLLDRFTRTGKGLCICHTTRKSQITNWVGVSGRRVAFSKSVSTQSGVWQGGGSCT